MKTGDENRLLFIRWLKQFQPDVYERAVAQTRPVVQSSTVAGIESAISTAGGFFDNLLSNVTKVIGAYGTYQTAKDWTEYNLERAKMGLAPIDPTTGRVVEGSLLPLASQTDRVLATLRGTPMWVWLALAGGVALLLWRR